MDALMRGLFGGRMRLPRIEALDLRPVPAEARPCQECGRLTRAGELCGRCQIVDEVARGLGLSRSEVWLWLSDCGPSKLDRLLPEGELLALRERVTQPEAGR